MKEEVLSFMTGGKADRVLIVRAGALGDTLMATPLIGALHDNRPGIEIDFLCSSAGAEVLKSNPYLARVLPLRLRNLPYPLSREKQVLVRELRSRQYDSAILLESAPRFRRILEEAGIPEIRSFANSGFDPGLHSIENNLRVGGFENPDSASMQMDFPIPPAAMDTAADLLSGLQKPLVGIHPGYGPNKRKKGQEKRLKGWSRENFAQVAKELVRRGASIALTGSADDVETCRDIAGTVRSNRVRILAAKTDIQSLGAVIKSLDLLISVDSGPAHVAAAVGTPLVVLWGPAILHQVRPVSSTSPISIMRVAVPCAPCYGTSLMKVCRRNICMELITPEQVIEKATALLKLAGAEVPFDG